MSQRFAAFLALFAALLLASPALMADHGDKGNKHGHGNKHYDADDDQEGGVFPAAVRGAILLRSAGEIDRRICKIKIGRLITARLFLWDAMRL